MNLYKFITSAFANLFVVVGFAQSTSNGFESLPYADFATCAADTAHFQILDVRRPDEFLAGHLPNAININVLDSSFEHICQSLLTNGKGVAVYCRSGRRSKKAAEKLVRMGFAVKELDGGFLSWEGQVVK